MMRIKKMNKKKKRRKWKQSKKLKGKKIVYFCLYFFVHNINTDKYVKLNCVHLRIKIMSIFRLNLKMYYKQRQINYYNCLLLFLLLYLYYYVINY